MDMKRRRKRKDLEEDAISKLPDDLLCYILSFLLTKEAAKTSLLSKRWRYLFTLIPCLDLDDSIFLPCDRVEEFKRTSFMEFVNRVFALQSNSPLAKFSLRWYKVVDENLVVDWIGKALRRGATDLTLMLLFSSHLYLLPLPTIILYGQNLVKLKLGCGKLSLQGGDYIFQKLKTLHFDSSNLGHDGTEFDLFLSKCPVLEELILNCVKWQGWSFASVSSQTLKRLTIDCEHYISIVYPSVDCTIPSSQLGVAFPRNVTFDTPNLLYLNYSEFLARNYPLVKLDSLVEARLDVGSNLTQMRARDRGIGVRWDATNLMMGICNVQTLHLTSDTIEVIADFCKTIPVFHNLKHLSIESDDERGWQALPLLLINCPNLQTLVFHGLHHRVTDGCGDACDCITSSSYSSSCLSSCPVKIMKILDFGATCGEMSLVEHFLKFMPQLEELTIVVDFDSSLEEDLNIFQVYETLEIAPRASPNCKLKVV